MADRIRHLPEADNPAEPAHPDHVLRKRHHVRRQTVRHLLGIQHVVLHTDEPAGLLHHREDLPVDGIHSFQLLKRRRSYLSFRNG